MAEDIRSHSNVELHWNEEWVPEVRKPEICSMEWDLCQNNQTNLVIYKTKLKLLTYLLFVFDNMSFCL